MDIKNPKPRIRPLPASCLEYKIKKNKNLPKFNSKKNPYFFSILKNRLSERNFSKLSLQTLSNLLWYVAKFKSVKITKKGVILPKRNVPSAGSLHPLDIFISLPTSINKRSLYHYNPFTHQLGRLEVNETLFSNFLNTVNISIAIKNATIVWFGCSTDIIASHYKSYESLVWRDAGSLQMTTHLTAFALNLKSCYVGTLGEPFFSKMLNNRISSFGGILVG